MIKMVRNLLVLVLIATCAFAAPAKKSKQKLIRDGFVLEGVDGKLTASDVNDVWFFEMASSVTDYRGTIKAGQTVRLLPCRALERLTKGYKKDDSNLYRIWALVTKYKGKNFIFIEYFLPVTEVKTTAAKPDEPNTVKIKNKSEIIPPEVMKILKPDRVVDVKKIPKLQQTPNRQHEYELDSVFADRIGYITLDPKTGKSFLSLDALGWNVDGKSFELLPCRFVEEAENAQLFEPDPLRYKVMGILTEYKNKKYLLLQRATRIYGHGNFQGAM